MYHMILLYSLIATTLQLSPNGTRELKIGVHFGVSAADLLLGAYTRVEQLNRIPQLIDPDVKLKLYFIQNNGTPYDMVKAALNFEEAGMNAVVAAGLSARTIIVSKSLQNANIPQW